MKHLGNMTKEELRESYERSQRMKEPRNGDKVNVYGADNRYHECIYVGKSPNEGHHIIYVNGKPWECANEMLTTN